MLVKDIGICIARRDYSETSQIATIFTREHGKVPGIAKGSRRPRSKFSQGLELLSRGQLVFSVPRSGSSLITLTEWTLQDTYQQLRRSLQRLYRGYYLAELVELFTEPLDPHPHLYDSLCRALENISANESWADLLTFQLNLLQEVGLSPQLSNCVRCGQTSQPLAKLSDRLSFTEGGQLCRSCAQAIPEKSRSNPLGLQLLHRIDTAELSSSPDTTTEPLADRAARQAQDLLSYWIRAALNREPKTAHLLR